MVPFIKMNGAGNDFVIFDARSKPLQLTKEQLRAIADRKNALTKGCDQVIVMEPSAKADVFMRIYNADGGEVAACGNATRCIAGILEQELGRLPVTIETRAGILKGVKEDVLDGRKYTLVDMGAPIMDWRKIPLAHSVSESANRIHNLIHLDATPYFISMGNPHVVFFLKSEEEVQTIDLEKIGYKLEHAKDIFPQGVNVSFTTIDKNGSDACIAKSRVWERGVGHTKACGTAACAILAAINEINPDIQKATIWFEENSVVNTELDKEGHILLGGPIEKEFSGELELDVA